MKSGLQRASATAALALLLTSAAAAQPACTQAALVGTWLLEIYLVRAVIHSCSISIDAKGKFKTTGCTSSQTFTELPAGVMALSGTCRVTGSFCFSTTEVSCATKISLGTQDSQMWLSNDATRVSGFGRGAVKLAADQSPSDIGVVPLELIGKSPKIP